MYKKHFAAIFMLISLSLSTEIWAQDLDEIVRAILKLPTKSINDKLIVDGQLYSGKIDAIITDRDRNVKNFEDGDLIDFSIATLRGNNKLTFNGTRLAFEMFVKDNAKALLQILFPTSISEGVSGKDAAQNHSQQLLVRKIFQRKTNRSQFGGLLEYEWFEVDNVSGRAWQGIFFVDRLSLALEGRYTTLHDDLNSKSYTLGLDFYPHFTLSSSSAPLEWLLGFDAYFIFLSSRSEDLKLGSLDFGGSIWTAARRDYSRFRFGAGAVLQGSKTYIPPSLAPGSVKFLVDAINDRALDRNLTYGSILGFLLSDRVSLNARIMQTHSFTRTGGADVTSQLIALVGLSYLFGDAAPFDIGYKIATGLDGVKSNSIVFMGNFRW